MKFVRDNGLTIVLVAATIGTLVGMTVSGLSVYNEELAEHRLPATTFASYVASGHFLSALFENWEREFLQMSAYVVLTAFLFQRGSAESKDPDQIEEHDLEPTDQIGRPGTPKSVRAGGLGRTLYAYSLGIALFTLFLHRGRQKLRLPVLKGFEPELRTDSMLPDRRYRHPMALCVQGRGASALQQVQGNAGRSFDFPAFPRIAGVQACRGSARADRRLASQGAGRLAMEIASPATMRATTGQRGAVIVHQGLEIELATSGPAVRIMERIPASTAAAIKASRACDSPPCPSTHIAVTAHACSYRLPR
ncbi:hypothetical protein Q9316_24855 (plasmid) [Shinella zoogloeoides]|nr:DUF6766 family protein [Shinella zoogloeoides]WLR95418.1 hypothetical protein Q9316_24855 [Shinella zoogloeoides]